MEDSLRSILDIQELDMQMIRLMRVKKERQKEVEQIGTLREEFKVQIKEKEQEISALEREVETFETQVRQLGVKAKKLESEQQGIKKIDEFNALTHAMTANEKERLALEQKISDLVDKRVAEEELLEKIKETLQVSEEGSHVVEKEIEGSIRLINQEGQDLKQQRELIAAEAEPDLLRIYDRLLRNKKDRVVVAIENRTCSGCHIALTAQHENLVRKGAGLIFCEHCSRIHYWQDEEVVQDVTVRRRRRRVAAV